MEDRHWIEVFKDRMTESLKEVLQEDMDWTTSLPILERLNRLREVEAMRARGVRVIDPWVRRKATPAVPKELLRRPFMGMLES